MEEKQVLVNGLNINYKVAGEGPAVLILHGWGGSSDSWLEVLNGLSRDYFVVVPDLPGFGKSVDPLSSWDVGDYVDFIFDFMQKVGLAEVFLIGHSFGGRVSIKFVNKHSNLVKKLILCGSAGIKVKPSIKVRFFSWLAKVGNTIFSLKYLVKFKEFIRKIFYLFVKNKDYYKTKGVMQETIKKVLAEDLSFELDNINIDTLLVWGELDKLVPLKYAHIFKEKIKGSKLEIMPGVGHSPHLEVPGDLVSHIISFIGR